MTDADNLERLMVQAKIQAAPKRYSDLIKVVILNCRKKILLIAIKSINH